MKKLFICVLVFTILLVGCSKPLTDKSSLGDRSVESETHVESSHAAPNPPPQSSPPVQPVTPTEEEPEQEPMESVYSATETVNSEPEPESVGEPESETAQHTPPPGILMFDNYDSISKLDKVLSRSESEIEAYLHEKNLYGNGLKSKEDIEAFLATLRGMYFPIAEVVWPSGITVYQGRNTVDVFYEFADEVRYVFNVSTEPNSAQKRIEAAQAQYATVKEISGASGISSGILSEAVNFPEGITVYAYMKDKNSPDYNESDTRQYFYMNVYGDYLNVAVFNANELTAAAKSLKAFDFVKLSFNQNKAQ